MICLPFAAGEPDFLRLMPIIGVVPNAGGHAVVWAVTPDDLGMAWCDVGET